MMPGSQFDGGNMFSGGGFMPSQTTQSTDPLPSGLSKNRDTQTLIPLTVKQINKAMMSSDDKVNFLIDGVDVNNVKLVGMLVNRVERVTDIGFALDDGTGRIDCNRWVHDPVDTKEMESIWEGMYVRVHGQLKSFQGKKQLVVFGIKPVTDFDEIAHHFVECIYVHSYNTKLMKQKASSSNQTYMPSSAAANTQTYQTAPSNQFTGQYVAGGHGLTGDYKTVLAYLNLPGSLAREAGVSQNELAAQLSIPLPNIKTIVAALVDEGLIYNSIDDYHYKSAANA